MGVLLKTTFSKSLTQKKSTNGLYKRLRLSTKYILQRSLTLEGIPITDSHKQHHRQPQAIKHLKFLKLPYLNPCHKLRPYKLRPHKLRLHKPRLDKLRLDKLRPHKLHLYKLRPHKLRLYKLRPYKLRLYKLRLDKLRPVKLRPTSNVHSNVRSNVRSNVGKNF